MKVAVSKSLRQIHRQLCLERGTVFSSLCPRLLRFHEATTKQPIRDGYGGNHRPGSRVPGRFHYLRYNAKDGCITGSNTTFESGTGRGQLLPGAWGQRQRWASGRPGLKRRATFLNIDSMLAAGPQPAPVTGRTHCIAGISLQADGLAWIDTSRSTAPPAIPNFLRDSRFDAGKQKSKKLSM